MLPPDQIREIIQPSCLDADPIVTLVKRSNDVYRITCGGETFFLKTYTKDWYGDDIAGTAFCVDHEAAAWAVLRHQGLSAPEVVTADTTCDNPLGRPLIVTRALAGTSLTALLQQADQSLFHAVLESIGWYMRAMHNITFDYPGYITSAGINAPPDPEAWQHSIWTAARFKKDMLAVWEHACAELSDELSRRMEAFFSDHEAALDQAFQVPRFTHGDCHAHQFFVDKAGLVSGVVDMEVASAGNPTADLFKFSLEMAAKFPAGFRWWQAFFQGYGEPSFDQLRLWMIANHHLNFQVVGWQGSYTQIIQHVLDAPNWRELFDLQARSITG